MPSISYDRFDGGLDVRRGASVSDANRLRRLRNAYVTTGKTIQKRPCYGTKIATLEAGTVGLKAAGGKLNTFYAAGTVSHANTLFQAKKVPHPSDIARTVRKVHYADMFLGYIYAVIEFDNGEIAHYYLDDDTTWVTATAYTLNTYRRPSTPNGFRYKATAIAGTGTTGGSEPVWPTTPGATVIDNAGVDQITWTCFSSNIQDSNCPNTAGVIKAANKIVAVNGETVRFCAAGAARDWTTASDAGFLPVGRYADGSSTAYGLGALKKQLVVFFIDGAQIWDFDEDPAHNAIHSRVYGVGTQYAQATASFSQDVFFLSLNGFRSITIAILTTDNFQDTDVGSPIDKLVVDDLGALGATVPYGLYVPAFGQYWCFFGNKAWVYTYSRLSKIAAWSEYTFDEHIAINAVAALNNRLYFRSGNDVYQFDRTSYADNGTAPTVELDLALLDNKEPGILKQYWGADFVGTGTPDLSFKYDPNDETKETAAYAYTGDTRTGTLHPVEVNAVNIGPVIMHATNEDFRLDALQVYYNSLGAV